MQETEAPDLARRFAGVGRIYGDLAAEAFRAASVCVVGIGGVGSWAAEALARSAIGSLTLIDLDMVAESNTNRQVHALDGVFGAAKVDVMADRIKAINPALKVRVIEDFVTADNAAHLLRGHDVVLDAIDQAHVKVAMAVACTQAGLPLVMCGAAGGKRQPGAVRDGDLSRTVQDPLLARVRAQLRKLHGFPRDPRRRFGIRAVYSEEPVQRPAPCDAPAGQGLSCAGYGSAVCVTATFGFHAAAQVLELVSQRAAMAADREMANAS